MQTFADGLLHIILEKQIFVSISYIKFYGQV